jgi:hypothetical protein
MTELRSPRTTLKRKPDRGSHDFDTIAAILDEAIYCHVGFAGDDGQPYVVPTAFGRDGRTLYIHGSAASRMLRTLSGGVPLCFTATIIDGLVIARSSFHNSINYRSVMVLGTASEVAAGDEKLHALRTITEHVIPGRWAEARPPTEQEMKASTVLRLPIEEASAKARTGGPLDESEDMDLPVWVGVLPLSIVAGTPVADPASCSDTVPRSAREYARPR